MYEHYYHCHYCRMLLELAIQLGDKLLEAFKDAIVKVPISYISLSTGKPAVSINPRGILPTESSLAAVGALQMELGCLSYLTTNPKYARKGYEVYRALSDWQKLQEGQGEKAGLLPSKIHIAPSEGFKISGKKLFGEESDSYYEYLLKTWVQAGGRDTTATTRTKRFRTIPCGRIIRRLTRWRTQCSRCPPHPS